MKDKLTRASWPSPPPTHEKVPSAPPHRGGNSDLKSGAQNLSSGISAQDCPPYGGGPTAPFRASGGGSQKGGILNFVTKRGRCDRGARLDWTQVEIGSAVTWKYPSTVLAGDGAQSDFYSLSVTRGAQQADTGTKMIHIGNNTKSNIVSYGVALEDSVQTFRSLVSFGANTTGAKNASKCDSRIIGESAVLNTLPTIVLNNSENEQSHEAATGAIPADALLYLEQSGIETDEATALIVSGLASPIISRLPMEFLVESKQLIKVALAK